MSDKELLILERIAVSLEEMAKFLDMIVTEGVTVYDGKTFDEN